MSAALGLTVFRIVQEGLTNARRHAPGAATTASVGVGSTRVDIEVANASPPASVPHDAVPRGTGTGLAGVRERVALFGGTIDAGPDGAGGFILRVGLPLQETDR